MPFSKFNLPFTLKIRREKINNDKNMRFALKYKIYAQVCVDVWYKNQEWG